MSSPAPVVVEQVSAAATQPSVVSQQIQYTTTMPTITYAAPQPVTYLAQPQVIQSGVPGLQPATYVPAGSADQQVTYVQLPGAEAAIYEFPQKVSHPYAPVHQGGSAELVQPVTYVQAPQAYEVVAGDGAVAESVSSNYATQECVVQQPGVFNVSPEIFAKLAAGGSLTPEELAQLTGRPAVSDPAAETQIAAAPGHDENPGTSSGAHMSSSKKKSNKSLKSKKKRAKGCC